MERLRKIIHQLSESDYKKMEQEFIQNKSENFLYLYRAYKTPDFKDSEYKQGLNCSENAYYVLKSRLYDKIQNHLAIKNRTQIKNKGVIKNNSTKKEGLPNNLSLINYLYEYPRETSMAILQKMEKQYVDKNSPAELMQLYSLFKKIFYHSNKYYQYSQAYNKQVAYAIAFEKAEDILFNFNKVLSNYFFSRSENDREIILVILQEIKNNYLLNPSHRIELIKNSIIVQILLFTDIQIEEEESIGDLLSACDKILEKFSDDTEIKWCHKVVVYLKFEYYLKISEVKKAVTYYDIINNDRNLWLLYNNSCFASRFLYSKICLLVSLNRINEIRNEQLEEINFDPFDFNTEIYLTFYKAVVKYYQEEFKEAIMLLEDILSKLNFKDFFHMEIEVRLTLAFLYAKHNKDINLDDIINPVSKRTRKLPNYKNANLFIDILNSMSYEVFSHEKKNKLKAFANKFIICNNQTNFKLLVFLEPEIVEMASLQ